MLKKDVCNLRYEEQSVPCEDTIMDRKKNTHALIHSDSQDTAAFNLQKQLLSDSKREKEGGET